MNTLKNYIFSLRNWQSNTCQHFILGYTAPIFVLILVSLLAFNNQGISQVYTGHQFLGDDGQPTLRAYEKAAKKAFRKKDYYTAIRHYESAIRLDSQKVENYYQLGLAARAHDANVEARNAFAMVVELDTINYPDAKLFYSIAEKNLGNYDQASILLEEIPEETTIPKYKIVNEIADLSFVDSMRYHNLGVDLEEGEVEVLCLDSLINTEYSEVSPVWRNEKLYYASLRFDKEEDEVIPARKIAKTLHSNLYELGELWAGLNEANKTTAHFAFTPDDSRMYFTICDYTDAENSELQCQIYYRDRNGNAWGDAIKLPSEINYPGYATTHPAVGLNEDGATVLYFVSNRPDGKGVLDIWYTPILDNNNFGSPVNMRINTKENDITPFYHYPTNALYFSSEGYESYGGYDIYKVNRMEGGRWTSINYLPEPLNSSFNDFDYFLKDNGIEGFLVSSRENCVIVDNLELACNDIFLVNHGVCQETEVLVNVFSGRTERPLTGAKVIMKIGGEIIEAISQAENEHLFPRVGINTEYEIYIEKENFTSDTISGYLQECKPIEVPVYLRPCENTTVIVQLYDAQTEEKLNGGIVTIKEGELEHRQENPEGNEFTFTNIFTESGHILIVEREGYITQIIECVLEPCKITQVPIRLVPECENTSVIVQLYDAQTEEKLNGGIVTIKEGEAEHRQENPNGNEFTFTNIFTESGHVLIIERRGYITQEIECVLEPCEISQVPIRLKPEKPVEERCISNLIISVFEQDEKRLITNATVIVDNGVQGEQVLVMGEDGKFRFSDDLSVAEYTITVKAPGYETSIEKYTREACQNTELTLTLIPEPDCNPSLTINIIDKETKLPVPNAVVEIQKASFMFDPAPYVPELKDATTYSNEFTFPIDGRAYIYWIYTNHLNYQPTISSIKVEGCQDLTLTLEMEKKPTGPFEMLPIACYFENAIPRVENSKRPDYSSTTFNDLYEVYHLQNGVYQTQFASGEIGSEARNRAISQVDSFFTKEVIAEYEKLEAFKDALYTRLQNGESFILSIRGYASNLDRSDRNKKLGYRRVWSVKNYFTKTYGALFNTFINNGQLELKDIPIGEVQGEAVFDDPNDRRNAVYNPISAGQRKAQIERADVVLRNNNSSNRN